MNRRDFLKGIGAALIAAVAPRQAEPDPYEWQWVDGTPFEPVCIMGKSWGDELIDRNVQRQLDNAPFANAKFEDVAHDPADDFDPGYWDSCDLVPHHVMDFHDEHGRWPANTHENLQALADFIAKRDDECGLMKWEYREPCEPHPELGAHMAFTADSVEHLPDGSAVYNDCRLVEAEYNTASNEFPILCDANNCPLGIADGDCPFNQNGFCL